MHNWKLLLIFISALIAGGCQKENEPDQPDLDAKTQKTYFFVNSFSASLFNTYYLWKADIQSDIDNWEAATEPIEKVKTVRYKDPSTGKDIDKWTMLTDDASSLYEQVSGNYEKSYGYDFILMYYDSSKQRICAVVTYVYEGGPAQKAGIKRGDAILEVNGKKMTPDNYTSIVTNEMMYSDSCKLSLKDGNDVTIFSTSLYEDPVLVYKTFDCNGKKVGYLNYVSFTAESCNKLIEACKFFKNEGIKELILDLRYNGGGLVSTENVLMSMLAPESNVLAGDVFEKELYNIILTQAWGDGETHFATSFEFKNNGKDYKFETGDANIGVNKIYALVTSQTASASEAVLTCLKPFVDVEIIGTQTYGKYCAGALISGTDWFDDVKDQLETSMQDGKDYLENWALYIMYARFSDKNGNTPCMPDGFVPDIECVDNPLDGYQLGDPQETMLAKALERAGYSGNARIYRAPSAFNTDAVKMERLPEQIQKPKLFVKTDIR